MIYQITTNPFLISNENTILTRQALSPLFALDSNFGISSTQAEKLVNIADNSLVLNRVSIYNNTKGINTVIHILDDTYNAMLKQLKPNDNISIKSNKIQTTIKTLPLEKLSNYTLCANNPKASVTFPSNFSIPSIQKNQEILLVLTFFDTTPAAKYSTPTIVSINLYALSNFNELFISNLLVPIKISIPIYNLNPNNLKCYYLDSITQR